MQTLYSQVTHNFIIQLSHRQYHVTITFHTILVTIQLNIIKQRDNSDVLASCHIPDENEQSGTHFLFTENIFTKYR